jgi:hypothetical protein
VKEVREIGILLRGDTPIERGWFFEAQKSLKKPLASARGMRLSDPSLFGL